MIPPGRARQASRRAPAAPARAAGRALPLLVAALLFAGCREAAPGRAGPAPGQPVPAYAAADLAGDTVSLAGLRGRPVLLNIWATWCAPCRREMPSLQRLHRDLAGQGLRIVAVSIDESAARDAVLAFRRDYGLEFTILHDPEDRISRLFRTIGVPETLLIDREGRLAHRWIGAVDADAESFRAMVRNVL